MFRELIKRFYRRVNRRLALRKNVYFDQSLIVGPSCFIAAPNRLDIGRDVSMGRNCWIACDGHIGNGVLISSYVMIAGRYDHDLRSVGLPISRAGWIYNNNFSEKALQKTILTIGDDVWIGVGSIILSGIVIGQSSVIAAGSVVTCDVPENTIVAGNPAKAIGKRFSDADFQAQKIALKMHYRQLNSTDYAAED